MAFKIPKRAYFAAAGCITFILFFTVFGEKGLLRIYELQKDKSAIEKKLTVITSDNEKVKKEIIALRSDHRYLESIARKEFGMVRSNEVVYQFQTDHNSTK